MLRRLSRFLLSLLVSTAVAAATDVDYRRVGHDHYFNLEYDQAISAYRRLLTQQPNDPTVFNHIASAILFKELLRLGLLESSAFKGDNQFLQRDKPKPDPQAKQEFEKILFEGRRLAESILDESSSDALALYALSESHALQGNQQFMVDKAYFAALRNGNRANKYSKQVRKRDPGFVDAYLVAGVHEYVLGSLPWPVKLLAAIGGMRGSKKKGEQWVRRVANEGDLARDQARALLALLLRREKRPLEAAEVIQGLINDFPRNYVLHLELAAMYRDAGQKANALAVFRSILTKNRRNEPGYDRMTQRAVGAVRRKIKKLEAELDKPATRCTRRGFVSRNFTS